MIWFDTEDGCFTFRVAGVAIVEGRVLLHRSVGLDYWVLPGGRVEMMEQARETLAREMVEETGREFEVRQLLWVVENFFSERGRRFHEIGMYFAMSPAVVPREWEFVGREGAEELEFRWWPLEELPELPIQPGFLRSGLGALPETAVHVVQT